MKDLVVSFSSLNTYARCPYFYYLRYIVRETTEYADYTGTIPGNVAHILTERFFKEKEKGIVDFSLFDREFNEVFYKQARGRNINFSKEAFAATKEEAKEKVYFWLGNLKMMLQELKVENRRTLSEFWFGSYKNPLKLTDKIYFTGAPDLWFELEDMKEIGNLVDFKASESTFHLNPKQLFLYAIAIEKALGLKTLMVGFFTFKTIGRTWFRFSEEQREQTLMWAENIVDNIKDKKFDPYPSKVNCKLCDFKSICSYSTYKTLKEDTFLMNIKDLKTKDIDFDFEEIPEL